MTAKEPTSTTKGTRTAVLRRRTSVYPTGQVGISSRRVRINGPGWDKRAGLGYTVARRFEHLPARPVITQGPAPRPARTRLPAPLTIHQPSDDPTRGANPRPERNRARP